MCDYKRYEVWPFLVSVSNVFWVNTSPLCLVLLYGLISLCVIDLLSFLPFCFQWRLYSFYRAPQATFGNFQYVRLSCVMTDISSATYPYNPARYILLTQYGLSVAVGPSFGFKGKCIWHKVCVSLCYILIKTQHPQEITSTFKHIENCLMTSVCALWEK